MIILSILDLFFVEIFFIQILIIQICLVFALLAKFLKIRKMIFVREILENQFLAHLTTSIRVKLSDFKLEFLDYYQYFP